MKETLWGYWIVVLGLFVIVVMMILQNYTTSNQQDYYLLKEVTDAAMHDSVDLAHFRGYGELRIIKEQFVENFLRRFSETVNINRTYEISFYDIYEAPPKVSVSVRTSTGLYGVGGEMNEFEIANRLDAILETAPGMFSEGTRPNPNIVNHCNPSTVNPNHLIIRLSDGVRHRYCCAADPADNGRCSVTLNGNNLPAGVSRWSATNRCTLPDTIPGSFRLNAGETREFWAC